MQNFVVITNIILASLLAFFLSLLTAFFIEKKFPVWGFMDKPKKYGHKRNPVPLPGGVGIPLVFCFVALLFLPFNKQIFGFVLAVLLLTIVSFWDDRKNISPFIRLGVQIFAGLILVIFGIGIEVISNPFGGYLELNNWEIDIIKWKGDYYQFTVLADLFTITWVVVMANTLNWLDGVSGLSGGTAAAGGITLGFLSLTSMVNQPEIALLSFVFACAIFAFLPFNIPPIKMLLGDAGAMPIGFILAVLAIFSGGKVATAFLVLALPILDAIWVAFYRLSKGVKPWQGRDRAHLHDKLLILGWNEKQIFLLFFLVSVFLGVSSLFLHTLSKGILIFTIFITFFVFRFWLEKIVKKTTSI